MTSSSNIFIGTSGWSYEDWNGIFYPLGMQRRHEHLSYLAQFFDMVEINASFSGHIRPEWPRVWAKRVEAANPRFKFTAKLHNSFTHASQDRPGRTSAASINPTHEDEIQTREGLDSLAATGKLAAVLAQFPFSYKNTPLNREYLAILARQFNEYPLVLEVLDEGWDMPDTIKYLAELQMAFCNIDVITSKGMLDPTEYVTSPIGYVHLHGRSLNYDYLYKPDELKIWAGKIKNIVKTAENTFVVMNNSPGAKAVVNAMQLKSLLTGLRLKAPEPLLRSYPELRDIADPTYPDADGISA
jgi:uncharacterized protein YecE (DUF72 family)